MLMFSCTNKAEMEEFERDLEAVSPHLREGADKLRKMLSRDPDAAGRGGAEDRFGGPDSENLS